MNQPSHANDGNAASAHLTFHSQIVNGILQIHTDHGVNSANSQSKPKQQTKQTVSSSPSNSCRTMNLSIDSSEFYSDNQTSPDSIKKRLNLHVKRRLLEQATTSQQGSAITSPQVVSSIPTATIVQAANFSPPVVPPKEPRKYKSQKKQPAGTDNPPPDSPGAKKKCTRKSTSVIKRTQDVQNDEMNDEDFAMAEVHPSENDQSMSSHAAMEATGETKTPHTLDILSIVLNEKKAALMNDPEIIRFLAGISMKLMEQQHQQPQQPQQTQQSQQPQPPQQPQQTQQTQQPQQLQQPQQPQQPRQPQQRNTFNR